MSIRGRLPALAIGGVVPPLLVGLTVLWVMLSEKQNQLNDALEQPAELRDVISSQSQCRLKAAALWSHASTAQH